MLKLTVVICSTRPGRVGESVGRWFFRAAEQGETFAVELVDLAEVNLPLLDEPNHPRAENYTKEHTKRWSITVGEADAFVFVTPEYNYSPPASLVNALHYLYNEWNYKPCGFVSSFCLPRWSSLASRGVGSAVVELSDIAIDPSSVLYPVLTTSAVVSPPVMVLPAYTAQLRASIGESAGTEPANLSMGKDWPSACSHLRANGWR